MNEDKQRIEINKLKTRIEELEKEQKPLIHRYYKIKGKYKKQKAIFRDLERFLKAYQKYDIGLTIVLEYINKLKELYK